MGRILLAFAGLLWGVCSAEAYFIDGNELHRLCNESQLQGYNQGTCTGYVIAIVEMLGTFAGGCKLDNVKSGQLRDVIKRYLVDHPEERHQPAHFLVVYSMNQSFRCNFPSMP
jgi:hypothetical protein